MSDSPPATATAPLPKDLASAQGLVNVQIDGNWHQFPRGTRMIEACRLAGVIVPHYCYHPKLSSPGNCRMCLVQTGMPIRPAPGQEPSRDESGYELIQWAPRPVIACANTIAENMGIRTKGDVVAKSREAVMEFLLINHPLDCPICDQAGECRLQELSVGYGRGTSRFVDPKIKKPKNVDIGPRVRLDDERCILCSRCIRFMDEVAGDPVLGLTQRGSHTTVSVHPGRLLDSNYSLNTVDICPVGALTSTDFRFQMRVWFLKETPSIDVNCGTGTNITIWTRENRIYRITPRINNEVNSWWMPDSHRLSFHALEGPARLTEPLLKDSTGKHRAAAWSVTLAETTTRLREFAPAEIAIVASARMTNEELFLAKQLATTLGTSLLATVPRIGEADALLIAADRNPNTTGAKLVWNCEDPAAALGTIREAIQAGKVKAVLALGEDLLDAAGFAAQDLAQLAFLLQTQTLANATAETARVVLPAASFAEKRGSMVNLSGRLQRLNRALEAPGFARDDWEILRDFIKALDPAAPTAAFGTIEDVFRAMADAVPAFAGLNLSKIGDLGLPLVDTGYRIPLLEKEQERKTGGLIVG